MPRIFGLLNFIWEVMEGGPRIVKKFSRIKLIYWWVILFSLKNQRAGGFSLPETLVFEWGAGPWNLFLIWEMCSIPQSMSVPPPSISFTQAEAILLICSVYLRYQINLLGKIKINYYEISCKTKLKKI